MPFTPAHTAIVLPLLRWRHFSATGLIIGSMAPDFEYFFKFSVDGVHGHTWAGLLYFDLPVTLLLSIAFHQIVRRNLILSMPPFFQSKFIDVLHTPFVSSLKQRPLAFIAAAIFGSTTHILWDAFTHGNGFFVKYFSFYDGAYIPFDGVKYPLWYALQHISTYVGMAIVAIFIITKRNVPSQTTGKLSYWLLLTLITAAAMAIRFALKSSDMILGNIVVSAISGLCIGLIVCGVMPFWRENKQEQLP